MKLLNEFYEYAKSLGLNMADMYTQEDETVTLVSFPEKLDAEKLLYISLAFRKDADKIEVYARKDYESEMDIDLLQRINLLNLDYSGVTFFVAGGMVSLRIVLEEANTIDDLVAKILMAITIATETFKDM